MQISIIIPILNEAEELPALLGCLQALGQGTEVLFVDGGSRDGSPALIRAAGYPLLMAPAGRARQMNTGAEAAAGDVFIFLHADARLTAHGVDAVRTAMRDPTIAAGRFDLAYDTSAWPYPWIAWTGNLRSRITRIFTGDQTIFIRRHAFRAVGGFPDIPLMEDVEISRRLKRLCRTVCLRARVVASTRKWRREGICRTLALMWLLRALRVLGVSPVTLHRLYYRRDPAKWSPPSPGAGSAADRGGAG